MSTAPQVSYDTANMLDNGEKENFVNDMGKKNAFVYQIKGRPAFAVCLFWVERAVRCTTQKNEQFGDIWLQNGARMIADPTGLLWMDGDVTVETGMRGGCCASYMRQCSGEPCCLNTYIGTGDNQKVTVGFELPGDLMAFGVTNGNGWCFSFDGFVAGTDNLIISSRFSGCCACICADEAPFLTTAKVKEGEMGKCANILPFLFFKR